MTTSVPARWLLLVNVILVAGWNRSDETPTVIGRTEDGSLIDTNSIASDAKHTSRRIRMDEYESSSHTKWECKYHVVFIPKCRRKVL
jgi:hypothetical protein